MSDDVTYPLTADQFNRLVLLIRAEVQMAMQVNMGQNSQVTARTHLELLREMDRAKLTLVGEV